MQGLQHLTELSALDITSNQMVHLEELGTLTSLQDLWADINHLSDWTSLSSALQPLASSLTCLSLAENPVCRTMPMPYQSGIKSLLPFLKELDGEQLD